MQIPFEIIAVDFDGTLCVNDYPEIGAPNTDLIEFLKCEQKRGTRIILWTCRCDERLQEAVDWCLDQGLIFDTINDNIPGVVAFMGNSNSRKVFATTYIDDKCDTPYSKYFKLPFRGEEDE